MNGLTIRIPGHPPGGNALHRMGHWKVRSERSRWRSLTFYAAQEVLGEYRKRGTPWVTPARAEIAVEWRFRLRRRRDYDNLVSGLKPLLDGLVDGAIIRDDSTDCLTALGPLTVTVGAESDETVLTVLTEEDRWVGRSPYAGTGGIDGA